MKIVMLEASEHGWRNESGGGKGKGKREDE